MNEVNASAIVTRITGAEKSPRETDAAYSLEGSMSESLAFGCLLGENGPQTDSSEDEEQEDRDKSPPPTEGRCE